MTPESGAGSTTARALEAAGDGEGARDIGALDEASGGADRKLAPTRRGLVERLIYGPAPDLEELQAGGRIATELARTPHPALTKALDVLNRGQAFTADGKLSSELRRAMAEAGAYGLTVPAAFGGRGESYLQLAALEEALAANGLGPMAVEVSGHLTIGAGSLIAYGSDEQKRTLLPLVAEGVPMAFALTEVGTGVNAKKIEAYVTRDENGDFRLFAEGTRNKLWITNARHGALVGIVARLGQGGKQLGLFLTRLPEADVEEAAMGWSFRCEPSGVAAFTANDNSRLHFSNYPIPAANLVEGDGVEVLFYSLRLGRCMLAAMSAGYQRMLAADAAHYARQRPGVGGLVIRHELPQLAIGRMLGGSLQARALAFLALSQDASGADLAGLRDLTKSSAAQTGFESMLASEHVLGGRSFAASSRVNAARSNLHLFGVVEGEDDMIRMGMVRDVTLAFVVNYLAPLLGELQAANLDAEGNPVAPDQRILKLGPAALLRHPIRAGGALIRLLGNPALYRLGGWVLSNLVPSGDAERAKRAAALPRPLRAHARFAERELARLRWTYLRLSITFQLELASAQIVLQRFGQQVEWLVSMLALCHHAASEDETQWRVADLQCALLRERVLAGKAGLRAGQLRRLRQRIASVGGDVAAERSSLLADIAPEPFAHPFDTPVKS
jgi:alkylation response protein AidB-like acyl-CoA dehydrogenase